MTYIFGFVLVVLFVVVLVRLFLSTQPQDLARNLRRLGAAVLILAALGLAIAKQFAFALALGTTGLMLWRRHSAVRTSGGGGGASSVRSESLSMYLDHDTGEMDGDITSGTHAGRRLSELDLAELLDLAEELRGEVDSLRLLEAYLDRTQPGWRDDVEGRDPGRRRAASGSVGMSTQEAYDILGVEPGAGEAEIREAHRRLMKQVHPDRGGTSALAARINEAKDHLIRGHS